MKTKFLSLLTILMAVNVMPVFSAPMYYETVSGTVTDEDKNTVDGAIIQVAYKNGTQAGKGTKTDTNGHFTLKDVPSDAVIIVSGSIYERKVIPVAETVNIQLKPNSLAEVSVENRNCAGFTGAVWSNSEKKCVCKKKYQKLENKVCVDKCSSADGLKWDNRKETCVCRDKNKDLKDGKCVDKEKPAESVPPAQKPTDTRSDEQKAKDMQEKQTAYETARDTEQSRENRLLTAATTAATGIGGMELATGLAEQRADKTAEQSMTNYIATMRCKYGDTQVKAGLEEIELPGGNDSEMAKYRNEYFALATDLKERKTALGMAPGIESEEILDKSKMGLYTQENIGISDGAYASLYRAQMYNSENDKTKINEAKEASENRVTIGATAAGIGVVGGIIGDQMINGNLGKKKNYRDMSSTEFNEWIKQQESSQNNLSNIRDCLKNKESSLDFNKLIQECAK